MQQFLLSSAWSFPHRRSAAAPDARALYSGVLDGVTHFVTAILADLNGSVFQPRGAALPPTFADIRASWRTSILHVCAAG
jgi:hypothetical protein